MKLELGCGSKPTESYVHHDRTFHSAHVDIAFDLETLPWNLADESCDEILAIDVLEHIRPWKVDMFQWMDELWRVLKPGGLLDFRIPHYDNPYTFRDPGHHRGYHPETFHYWCPDAPGTVHKDFGGAYGITKTWSFQGVTMEHRDLRFKLRKA